MSRVPRLDRFAIYLRIALPALLLLVPGCGPSPQPPYEILHTDPAHREALDQGFALAPVDQAVPVIGGKEALAFLSNELYTSLLVFTGETEILDPAVVLKRAESAGDEAKDLFRQFHRDRINGKEIEAAACARIFPLIGQRFLALAWVDEKVEMGVRDNADDDYTQLDYAHDINDVAFRTFEGALHLVVVDLVRAERVWEGVARYSTGEMYADNDPEDLWTMRSRACSRLGRMFSLD
jgi:hypothetical protein